MLPSSKYLAQEMASYVSVSPNHFVVELGPGTGVITEALLRAGISAKQIIAIEQESNLAGQLGKRFPDTKIIIGDAAHLNELFDEKDCKVDTIISSLPLRSLPDDAVQSILSNISSILPRNGKYIQFTYNIRSEARFYPEHFHLEASEIIWRNIPPAKVQVFSIAK